MRRNIYNIWRKCLVNVFAAVILFVLISFFISLMRIYMNIFYSSVGETIFMITVMALFVGLLIISLGSHLFLWLRKTAARCCGYSRENEFTENINDDGIIPEDLKRRFLSRSLSDEILSAGKIVLFYKLPSNNDRAVRAGLLIVTASTLSCIKDGFFLKNYEVIGWCKFAELADFLK